MREETIKIYKFEELSNEAKKVAREWWKSGDFAIETSMVTEIFSNQLDELGYPVDNIEWSLSHCQGDGMAFYGKIHGDELVKIARRLLAGKELELFDLLIENDFSVFGNISKNSFGHHYSHWNTMEVDIKSDDIGSMVETIYMVEDYDSEESQYKLRYAEIEKLLNTLESCISDEIKEVSKRLESEGCKEIDYQYSNEVIDENIICNEYEFTVDGKRY